MNMREFKKMLEEDAQKYAEDPEHVKVLFHGTNKNALLLSEEERNVLKIACEDIIQYFLNVFKENGVGQLLGHREELGDDFLRLSIAYTAAHSRNNGVGLYDYANSYLTFDYNAALDYAGRARVFGETGHIIICLYEAFNRLGFKAMEMTEEVSNAFRLFTKRMKMPDEPIVMAYFNVNRSQLQMENGATLIFQEGGVRVVGPFDLTNGIEVTSLQNNY